MRSATAAVARDRYDICSLSNKSFRGIKTSGGQLAREEGGVGKKGGRDDKPRAPEFMVLSEQIHLGQNEAGL